MIRTVDNFDDGWHSNAHSVLMGSLDALETPNWASRVLSQVFHNDELPWRDIRDTASIVRSNTHPGLPVSDQVLDALKTVATADITKKTVSRSRALRLGANVVGKTAQEAKSVTSISSQLNATVAQRLEAIETATSGMIGNELVDSVLTRDVRSDYLIYLAAGLFDAQNAVDLNGLSLAKNWLRSEYPRVGDFVGQSSIEGITSSFGAISTGRDLDLSEIDQIELTVRARMFNRLLRLRGLDTLEGFLLRGKTIEGRKSFNILKLTPDKLLRATTDQFIGLHTVSVAQLAISLAQRHARVTGFSRDRIEPGRATDPRLRALQTGVDTIAEITDVTGSNIARKHLERSELLLEKIRAFAH